MEATMCPEKKNKVIDVEGQKVRRKFVGKGKLAAFAMLAICWMSHISSEGTISRIRANRQEFVQDSMRYDLLTNGTAIGAYASSPDAIARRWGNVSNEDEQKWRQEDNGKAVNFIILLAFSTITVFFFCVPKGKQIIDGYVKDGFK